MLTNTGFDWPSYALKMYDQYDRDMSSTQIGTFLATANYTIAVSATGNVSASAANIDAYGNITVTANALTGGSGNVSFTLEYDADGVGAGAAVTLNTVTASFAVVKSTDIVDYTMADNTDAIYASVVDTASPGTPDASVAVEEHYAAWYSVYGKTSSGAKVLLAATPINNVTLSNELDFNVLQGSGSYDNIAITANKLNSGVASSSTIVTVNVLHNGEVTPLKSTLTSSTVAPTATGISVRSAVENKKTVAVADLALTQFFTEWTPAGAATSGATRTPAYFRVSDSYGLRGLVPVTFHVEVVTAATGAGAADLDVNQTTGQITTLPVTTATAVYRITAVTNNGLSAVIELTVNP